MNTHQVYDIHPRNDKRGVDLISDVLPFGRLWYGEPDAISNAIGYAEFFSRSHHAVIRVYNEAGNVIETHEQASEFKERQNSTLPRGEPRNHLVQLRHGQNRVAPRRDRENYEKEISATLSPHCSV